MDRLEGLWIKWIQDQNTKTIEKLIALAEAELESRRNHAAFKAAQDKAIHDRLRGPRTEDPTAA